MSEIEVMLTSIMSKLDTKRGKDVPQNDLLGRVDQEKSRAASYLDESIYVDGPVIVELSVNMHCEACAEQLKSKILKMREEASKVQEGKNIDNNNNEKEGENNGDEVMMINNVCGSVEEENMKRMIHYYQPLYVIERIPAPQLFSDENPNACCISKYACINCVQVLDMITLKEKLLTAQK
ncbi:heavy metal-associated isoprenylated plant protein 9-like [Humulus lupulus]|uniref:heavy metal-associated isoprenylated plant protein 9-like n=1 Tax=Humulus lupulus TaxID=3486 RepID=UPI002B40F9C9|nr:heavy metal-associated isoprenylated plant protein 9-like [Humulus lupulus]